MDDTLHAGAPRRTINPPLGIGKIRGRLFGDPVQWIESDLTATALVLSGADTKVAIVATDLCTVESRHTDTLRGDVGDAIGVPRQRPQHPLHPWEPVDGDTCTHLAAAETNGWLRPSKRAARRTSSGCRRSA